MSLPSLIGMTPDQLRDAVVALGQKPFVAKQLAQWLYEKRETDPGKMSNLPAALREILAAQPLLTSAETSAFSSVAIRPPSLVRRSSWTGGFSTVE